MDLKYYIRAGGKTPLCSSYIVIVNTNPHFLTAKMATNGDKSSKIKVASNHYWDSAMLRPVIPDGLKRKKMISLETDEEDV